MKRTLTACAVLVALGMAAAPAIAGDLVARQGSDEAVLYEGPCVHEATLAQIPLQLQGDFHRAAGRFNGQVFTGCWRAQGSVAHLVWEDGDQGIVPFAETRPFGQDI